MKTTLLNLALSAALVFLPIKAALIVVMILTLIDLISGVWAAKHRGEPITSKGFQRTIVKILAYEAVVMLAFLVQQYLTGDVVPLVKILSGMIGITELKSVLENIQEISGVPLIQLLIEKITQINLPPQ